MNLIEEPGGYEKAKAELKDKKWRRDNLHGSAEFTWHMKQHIELLEKFLLNYRREHGIFEVGDKVVYNQPIGIDRVVAVNNEHLIPRFLWQIRHATDEEIKAGHRL